MQRHKRYSLPLQRVETFPRDPSRQAEINRCTPSSHVALQSSPGTGTHSLHDGQACVLQGMLLTPI